MDWVHNKIQEAIWFNSTSCIAILVLFDNMLCNYYKSEPGSSEKNYSKYTYIYMHEYLVENH